MVYFWKFCVFVLKYNRLISVLKILVLEVILVWKKDMYFEYFFIKIVLEIIRFMGVFLDNLVIRLLRFIVFFFYGVNNVILKFYCFLIVFVFWLYGFIKLYFVVWE